MSDSIRLNRHGTGCFGASSGRASLSGPGLFFNSSSVIRKSLSSQISTTARGRPCRCSWSSSVIQSARPDLPTRGDGVQDRRPVGALRQGHTGATDQSRFQTRATLSAACLRSQGPPSRRVGSTCSQGSRTNLLVPADSRRPHQHGRTGGGLRIMFESFDRGIAGVAAGVGGLLNRRTALRCSASWLPYRAGTDRRTARRPLPCLECGRRRR